MRVLLVSPDPDWLEYEGSELKGMGIDAIKAQTAEEASELVDNSDQGTFDAACISALLPDRLSESAWVLSFEGLVAKLRRKMANKSPIRLWSPFLSERRRQLLTGLFKDDSHTSQVWSDEPSSLKAALSPLEPGAKLNPRWATVDLEIRAEAIHVQITVDGRSAPLEENLSNPARWMLQELEDCYREWKPWEKPDNAPARYTQGWENQFKNHGRNLARELQYGSPNESGDGNEAKLHNMVDECVKSVGDISNVHFRFTLLGDRTARSNPYRHVPFELLYDPPKNNFVRAMSPVARRIHLPPDAVIHKAPAENPRPQPLNGPVLFVQSDANGTYEGSSITFHERHELVLGPLKGLEEELRRARSAWKKKHVPFRPIKLQARSCRDNALKRLRRELLPPDNEPRPQILHFAGHSVCDDRGELYLVLPGTRPGALKLVDFKDLADLVKESPPRLLILSSCESTSPGALLRAAQYGIPEVVGFRWEVDDKEAAYFTARLHESLAEGEPLARAFHAALKELRLQYRNSPAFASAMLVAQEEAWAN